MNILVEIMPYGILPLPIEVTKLGTESMEKLEKEIHEAMKYFNNTPDFTESEDLFRERVVKAIQEATTKFINRIKTKDTPILLRA